VQTLVTMIACLASFGCGDAAAAKPAPLPPVSGFAISYSRGGGFAPSVESLVVSPGRRAVATVDDIQVGERKVRFRIGVGRVRALQTSLRRAHFGTIESDLDSGCADCYRYEIGYRGHRIQLDQSVLPEALEPVIGELSTVVSTRIPPNF
jgi:hypothetical protein